MLNITYYTDPLCCWSWGFEPQWRRFRYEYASVLQCRYCMGGLLPSWNAYNDETNNVTRPIQMGPVWMHAGQLSGMPVNTRIWMEDPPTSSYPACIAVKSAMLQSEKAGEMYLRLVREAIMLEGRNISRVEVLMDIAKRFSLQHNAMLDVEKFAADFDNGNAIDAFRADINEVRLLGINRFPTLVIKGPGISPGMLTGYRDYSALVTAIHQIAPQLNNPVPSYSNEDYTSYWHSVTERELAEIRIHSLM